METSKGKMRPSLVRSGDVAAVDTVPERRRNHDAKGHVVAGNDLGRHRGMKMAVRRMLGGKDAPAGSDVAIVAADATRLFLRHLAELPNDGATVRSLVGLCSRHAALAAFYTAKADAAGLESERGIALAELASKHGMRVERLSVTAYDLSVKLAAKVRPEDLGPVPWLAPDPPTEDPHHGR